MTMNPASCLGPPAAEPPPSDAATCFVCLDDVVEGPDVVRSVCLCKNLTMHLECQSRMIMQSQRGRPASQGRCTVCLEQYTNVRVRTVRRPTRLLCTLLLGSFLALFGVLLNEGPFTTHEGIWRVLQLAAEAVLVAAFVGCFYAVYQRDSQAHVRGGTISDGSRPSVPSSSLWIHRNQRVVSVFPPSVFPPAAGSGPGTPIIASRCRVCAEVV